MGTEEITQKLNLRSLSGKKQRKWFVQGACAISGSGLDSGIMWIGNMLRGKNKKANKQQQQDE